MVLPSYCWAGVAPYYFVSQDSTISLLRSSFPARISPNCKLRSLCPSICASSTMVSAYQVLPEFHSKPGLILSSSSSPLTLLIGTLATFPQVAVVGRLTGQSVRDPPRFSSGHLNAFIHWGQQDGKSASHHLYFDMLWHLFCHCLIAASI